MIVYHGSSIEVNKPDTLHSRDNVDFGKGFYVTPLQEQALKWAVRFKLRHGAGVVSIYDIDMEAAKEKYSVLEFDGYTEEWLDFITSSRRFGNKTNYDVIIGGVANDKVFNTIELFFEGLIEKKEAIKRLQYEKPNQQICVRNQKFLEMYCHFIESEEI